LQTDISDGVGLVSFTVQWGGSVSSHIWTRWTSHWEGCMPGRNTCPDGSQFSIGRTRSATGI